MKKIKNSISALPAVPVYAEQFNELIDELDGTITPSAIITSYLAVNGQGDFSSVNSNVVATSYIIEKVKDNEVTIDGVLLKDGMVSMATQTLAAAGSAQGDAGAITGQVVFVTGADATKGVILPAVSANKIVIVLNQANAVLKIYPATGEKINGGTANAAVSVAAYSFTVFGYKAAGDWNAAENAAAA